MLQVVVFGWKFRFIWKYSACRHNEKTVELTGQSGHFWLDFEKESDAQEWWSSMQSLNIAKNRSSFTPYVSQSTDSRISRTDTETSLSYSSMSKHAPVKILPNSSRASSTVPLHSSSSPPPIKPSQSSATLTSTGKFIFQNYSVEFRLRKECYWETCFINSDSQYILPLV